MLDSLAPVEPDPTGPGRVLFEPEDLERQLDQLMGDITALRERVQHLVGMVPDDAVLRVVPAPEQDLAEKTKKKKKKAKGDRRRRRRSRSGRPGRLGLDHCSDRFQLFQVHRFHFSPGPPASSRTGPARRHGRGGTARPAAHRPAPPPR